jgi:hypothetical protein
MGLSIVHSSTNVPHNASEYLVNNLLKATEFLAPTQALQGSCSHSLSRSSRVEASRVGPEVSPEES